MKIQENFCNLNYCHIHGILQRWNNGMLVFKKDVLHKQIIDRML
jgi:hypothetical protein